MPPPASAKRAESATTETSWRALTVRRSETALVRVRGRVRIRVRVRVRVWAK